MTAIPTGKYSANFAAGYRDKVVQRFFSKTFQTVFFFFLLFFPLPAEQQHHIDFYGIASPDADSNMTSMTEDLFFAQLKDIATITVTDKRSSSFSARYLSEGKPPLSGTDIAFYAFIRKNNDTGGTWTCIMYLTNPSTGQEYSWKKDFDSYYKMLMDAKPAIQAVFDEQFSSPSSQQKDENTNSDATSEQDQQVPITKRVLSTDVIAGTWSGEPFIDKIVILRGGRGFIIFKNGAAMSIVVAVSHAGSLVTVTQSGESNASYFPELPRKTALELATTAEPIVWIFSLSDNNILTGIKKTFVLSGTDNSTAVRSSVSVTWIRKQ